VASLADTLEQRVAQTQRRGRVADEPRRFLLRLRLRMDLQAVLRREVVELVPGTRRLDQVGGDHRVVHGLYAKGLRVVSRDLRFAQITRTGGDYNLGVSRNSEAVAVSGDADDAFLDPDELALSPAYFDFLRV
jgi:hypothetical protein